MKRRKKEMNKAELISKMAELEGTTKKAAGEQVDAIVSVITEALKNGDEVSLTGFGKFSVVERAERQGVNPATSEKITIPASKAPKFKASSALKNLVNGK